MQMLVCYIFMVLLILPMARYMSRVVWIPTKFLVPLILSLVTIAAFSEREYIFDMGLALFFGLVGYFARKGKYEVSAMLIGVIMGPLFETYFLRSMRIGQGDLTILFSSWLGNAIWLMVVASLFLPFIRKPQEVRRAGADRAGRPRELKISACRACGLPIFVGPPVAITSLGASERPPHSSWKPTFGLPPNMPRYGLGPAASSHSIYLCRPDRR